MSVPERKSPLPDAALVAAAALALYLAAGVRGFGFVNYDDAAVVLENPVKSWGTLGNAFTERMAHAWLPLYALSLGVDNLLFGTASAAGHHLHSVLLHALNAVLVLLVARRLGAERRTALLAGLLFAVHPAVSESVAWVASRKDVLSFAFAAAAALVFLREEGPREEGLRVEEKPRRLWLHAAGAFLLGCGMLAKGSVVVVPALLFLAVIGLHAAGPERRRGLLATIPYFAVAGILAGVHYVIAASEGTAGASLGAGDTLAARMALALMAMGKYFVTMVIPWPLSVEHGIGPGTTSGAPVILYPLALVGALLAAALLCRTGSRARVAGLLLLASFLALSPFNGIFPRTSVMYAERYLYVPAALLCGFLALPLPTKAGAAEGLRPWLLPLAFASFTFGHLPVWRDSLSLWENAVKRAPQSHLAHAKYGEALAEAALAAGETNRKVLFERAVEHHRKAAGFARSPLEEMRARHDAGLCLLGAGDPVEAGKEFAAAGALAEKDGAAPKGFLASLAVNRAKGLEAEGREAEAAAVLEACVSADPSAAAAWLNLGVLRMRASNLEGARTALLAATKAAPDLTEARLALADLEALGGDFAAALRIAVKAAEGDPRNAGALAKCGEIAFLLGQPVRAEEWFRKSLAAAPGGPLARRGLAGALAFRARAALGEGKGAEGLALAREATATDPEASEAWFALGDAHRVAGDGTAALEAYFRAGKAGGGRRADDARAAVHAARALERRRKGDGAGARADLEAALAEKPSEIRAGGRRSPVKEGIDLVPPAPTGGDAREPLLDGILALLAGEPAVAAERFGAAAGRVPGEGLLRPAALVFRSRARIAADDFDGAVADLEDLAKESGSRARPLFLLGHTLSARAARLRTDGKAAAAEADSARARAVLAESRAADPGLLEASLALAELHFVEGRSVDAIRELNAVLAKDPDRVEAHLVLGNIMKAQFAESGERSFREQAEDHFRRALAADPADARALAGLGEMAAFGNRAKEALAYALRALAADPELHAARALAATLFVRVGRARLEEGDADGALEAAKRADGLAGETAALCLLRADALRRKGDWPAAGAEVERARTLAPADGDVRDAVASHYRDCAYAFLLHKRRDQAAEALRRAEAAGSTRVDLSEVKRLLEGDGAAGAKAPGLHPDVVAALARLEEAARGHHEAAAALLREGKPAEAAARFRESLKALETSAARFGLGLSLAADGKGAEAEGEFRRAGNDTPDWAEPWLNLGALLFRRGADPEAIEAYGKYLERAPATGAEETVVRVRALVDVLKERLAKAAKPEVPK